MIHGYVGIWSLRGRLSPEGSSLACEVFCLLHDQLAKALTLPHGLDGQGLEIPPPLAQIVSLNANTVLSP